MEKYQVWLPDGLIAKPTAQRVISQCHQTSPKKWSGQARTRSGSCKREELAVLVTVISLDDNI